MKSIKFRRGFLSHEDVLDCVKALSEAAGTYEQECGRNSYAVLNLPVDMAVSILLKFTKADTDPARDQFKEKLRKDSPRLTSTWEGKHI